MPRHARDDSTVAHRPRILSIDDDPDIGALIAGVAASLGYQAESSTDFRDFQARYRDDLAAVILDLQMPDVDGIEVLRFLAAKGCTAGVIVASGFDARVLHTAHQLARAQGLRMLGSLSKPFEVGVLTALLTDLQTAPSVLAVPSPEEFDVGELRRGLAAGEIVAFFQPKVDVQTNRLVAVEALARWEHPRLGLIQPDAFIGLAEESGLIDEMTYAVMSAAAKQCGAWHREGLDLRLSVNLSPRSLASLGLPDRLEGLVRAQGLAPEHVVLEVTESWLAEDVVAALDVLSRLRLKGFGLSIDDFGTGYSTMKQLHQVPFSELKVDQSFVRGAASDSHARTIVDSSVELGHALHLRVVAEGVETSAEWELVKLLGCDEAQGHYISQPMCGADVSGWLASWETRQL